MKNNSRIKLVVFDWAGTTIDFGSCAPARAFEQLFASYGISLSSQQARGPMGTNKRDHLIEILEQPEVGQRWLTTQKRPWVISDVDRLYHEFIHFQLQAIEETSSLVPGLLETIAQLRERNIRIGGTTGYFRQAADAVLAHAIPAGFQPDINVCADDVPAGRPAPWMIYRVMEALNIYPPASVVNVGDTTADIQAGLSAGCWSVGVCDSSSETGLSLEEFRALEPDVRQQRLQTTAERFLHAGAHAVIPSISDLPALIEQLESQPTPHVLRDHNSVVTCSN